MADSDSSEEDLSRFKEAVDTNFIAKISQESNNVKITNKTSKESKKKSERYLDEASHYNDVKVPKDLQIKIAKKISTIINKNVEFVEVEPRKFKRKIKGGVKLFSTSEEFLTCAEVDDTQTESHNIKAKKLKQKKTSNEIIDEEKLKSVAVSGEYVLSKEETKCWKSRRKEKLFKYKSNGNGVLVAIE
ncbi:unnamed protein product [Leptosia nina]|uniref:Protein CUSTOS n=1 Tax=Leptosia nina TaxID=320188 RepID=A0AAV1IZT6_9NEOP